MTDTVEKQLPEGWISCKINDVAFVNPPKPSPRMFSDNDLVTFVPMKAVDAKNGTIAQPETREYGQVRKGFTAFIEKDVLFAKITPCMENGKSAIAADLVNGIGFGSTEFYVLRSLGAVTPEYLFRYVRREDFRKKAEGQMTGTVGQKRVPKEVVVSAIIPLAPLPEQKRIADKVEKLLDRVNKVKARLDKVPTILKRFRQSILSAACSGKLTEDWREKHPDLEPVSETLERVMRLRASEYEKALKDAKTKGIRKPKKESYLDYREVDQTILAEVPEKWSWIYLPLLGELNRGRSRHRPRNASHLYGGPYPFVQTGDIAQSGGRITNHKQTYSDKGFKQSRLWPEGTVCITIAANIADSAVLTYPACFPDSVVGLLADERICNNMYAEFFIRTARNDLSQYAPATAQKNINLGILNEVAVPIPPVKEQQEIVRRVEKLFELADKIEQRLTQARQRVDKITQSILAKAFRGELVPTEAELARLEGRSYETAEELMVRIRSEKQNLPQNQKAERRQNSRY